MGTEEGLRLSLCGLHRVDSQLLKVTDSAEAGWLQALQDVSGPSQADENGQVTLHEAVSSEGA